jgi:hypothetical protein
MSYHAVAEAAPLSEYRKQRKWYLSSADRQQILDRLAMPTASPVSTEGNDRILKRLRGEPEDAEPTYSEILAEQVHAAIRRGRSR